MTARYLILDTIQLAASIYHLKLTKIQYRKLSEEFPNVFDTIGKESSGTDRDIL